MAERKTKAEIICETLRKELPKRPGGRALPSERVLMKRFGVARETVRRALASLQSEGLVVKRLGCGTFPSRKTRHVPGRIGLIVLSYAEIFSPICAEIARLCRVRGLEFLFGDVSALDYVSRAEQAMRFARDFVERGVGGVILQPIGFVEEAAKMNAEMREIFSLAGVPVVLLDSDWPDGTGATDLVATDNFHAGETLANHLLSQGIRKTIFLTRPNAPQSNVLRYHGVKSRMECDLLEMEAEDSTLLRKALRRRTGALVCGYDAYAAHVLKNLSELGVSVPDDILLTGFDDVKYSTLVSPALTTIHQPCAEIARVALDVLMQRRREPERTARAIQLRAPLVVRSSTIRKRKG